jgi:hypothetical protein
VKKLVKVSMLFGIAALVMLLAVGVVGAQEIEPEIEVEIEPGGEGEVEPEPEAAEATEAGPEGTAARIDFEIAGHTAKKGHYSVQALGDGCQLSKNKALEV